MHFRITHITEYLYSAPVTLAHHAAHLEPRSIPRQDLLRAEVRVDPQPTVSRTRTDFFGNRVHLFTLQDSHTRLFVESKSEVKVHEMSLPDPALTPPWEVARDGLSADRSSMGLDVYQFVFDSRHAAATPELADYAGESFTPGRPILEASLDLTRRIFEDFKFDSTATSVSTPLDEVLEKRAGVCQDFAHLEVGCLRALGLAARYVSGYIRTTPPPGQPRLLGADASHAWPGVYCPGHGWIGLDPTNNKVVGQEHITVAWGRDFADVSPLHGVILGGGSHTLGVGVSVEPVDERGRATLEETAPPAPAPAAPPGQPAPPSSSNGDANPSAGQNGKE